jgi:uncharacterized membrane protein
MINLLVALAAFVGTHFLMSHPLRAAIARALGAAGFMGIYSLVSLATFGWAIMAFRAAPASVPYWIAGDLIWWIASVLMLVGSVLFAGSLFGNPALPRPDAAELARAPVRGVFGITRHPMMWGFALWALVHVLVAPNCATIALAAAMALLALGGSLGQDAKKARLMGDGWRDWASRTSFIPFGNQLGGRTRWKSAWPGRTAVLAGTALWLIATYFHPRFGLPVAGIWRWMG